MLRNFNSIPFSFSEYRKAWKKALFSFYVPIIPLNIDLELSAICNLRCPFCFYSSDVNIPKRKSFMDLSLARKIIKEAYQLHIPALKFNWIGEPTLHPAFTHIIDFASQKKFHDLLLNTNGNYISENIINSLIKLTSIVFSVDSFIPQVYRVLRSNGNLSLVINNIEKLLKKNYKNIIIRRVITEKNQNENFQQQVSSLFGNKVKVSEHYEFNRNLKSITSIKHKNFAKNLKRKYCGYPSQRLVISTEGDVFPCCVDTNHTMKVGNVHQSNISLIWYSPRIQNIRKYLFRNIMPTQTCENCSSWIAYQHPYAKPLEKK